MGVDCGGAGGCFGGMDSCLRRNDGIRWGGDGEGEWWDGAIDSSRGIGMGGG